MLAGKDRSLSRKWIPDNRRAGGLFVQDIAIDYLKHAVDANDLRPKDDTDPIHFCTFKMKWNDTKWELEFHEIVSTDLEGINRILGGSHSDNYPSVEDFKKSILNKGKRDGVFK